MQYAQAGLLIYTLPLQQVNKMANLIKGDAVKAISDQARIDALVAEGWALECVPEEEITPKPKAKKTRG